MIDRFAGKENWQRTLCKIDSSKYLLISWAEDVLHRHVVALFVYEMQMHVYTIDSFNENCEFPKIERG